MEFSAHNIWLVSRSIIGIFLTLYIGLSLLLTLFQSHMVYYPESDVDKTPGSKGLPFKDVFFESKDKVKLHGWFRVERNAEARITGTQSAYITNGVKWVD